MERFEEDLLKCVRCGSCKALCPTYEYEHVEPMSPRGRLMLLYGLSQGDLKPGPYLVRKLSTCALCGMCDASCPAGVDVTGAIYHSREVLRARESEGRRLRALAGFSLRHPALGFKAARLLRPLLPYLMRKGEVPYEVSLPEAPLKDGGNIFKPEAPRGRVAVFAGCAVNFLHPRLGEALIKVLIGLGYEVVLPPGEVCCGAPLRAMGLGREAAALAEKNAEIFGKLRAEAVLSLCPTCTLALKAHYPKLIGQGIDKAMDVSEFLAGRLGAPLRPWRGRVVYHDPCHLAYGLGVRKEPRKLLELAGAEVTEPENPGCCGFSLGLTHREISEGLMGRLEGGLPGEATVVTACPGCMMQIGRLRPGVRHLIEIIDRATDPDLEEGD
ncbi:MAG: (Fe-S)-binding protein [Thermodesulfovibrionales bacterium]